MAASADCTGIPEPARGSAFGMDVDTAAIGRSAPTGEERPVVSTL